MAVKFVSKSAFTELEPALESLFRLLKVHESSIKAMRVNEILDRSVFSDLAQAKSRTCAAAFGFDQSEDADFSIKERWQSLWALGAERRHSTK